MSSREIWNLITKKGASEVVTYLQANNIDAKVINSLDRNGRSPLHIAGIRKSAPITAALVAKGANVNLVDAKGISTLHIAAGLGATDVVQALLGAGADPFLVTAHRTALDWASMSDTAVVARLVGVPNDAKRFNAQGRRASAQAIVNGMAAYAAAHAVLPGFSGLNRLAQDAELKGVTNSFCPQDATGFQVRLPPNYDSTKAKGSSARAFYDLLSVDIFTTDCKRTNLGRFLQFPSLDHHADMEGLEGLPKFYVYMVFVPLYKPAMFGSSETNGEGIQIMMTFSLSEYAKEQFREAKSNAARLAKRFLTCPLDSKSAAFRAQHKCICRLVNPQEGDFGWVTQQLISNYNAKPFMTGPNCHTMYRGVSNGMDYMELNCDPHSFCKAARQGLFNFLGCQDTAVFDMCVLVEGRGDAEQPEQVLGSCRIVRFQTNSLQSWDHWRQSAQVSTS